MRKLIAFYILSFSFLLIQDGLTLNVKKNVMNWEETSSVSFMDLEDEGDIDDTIDEEAKDYFCANNPFELAMQMQLQKQSISDFNYFLKDVQLELLSPPPQLS